MKLIERAESQPAAETLSIERWQDGAARAVVDAVVVEEPLAIRLAGWDVAVTMRTPGHDLELAAGFLFTEGIISGIGDIATIASCPDEYGNVVNVNPADPAIVQPERWQRNFFAASSCGLCGKASIESIRRETAPVVPARVHEAVLYGLNDRLRAAQELFGQTGGLHAAGIFDLAGSLRVLREDIGRHNAVDKVIGSAVLASAVPLSEHILFVSGRVSFEIVQKAVVAGIPVLAAVSAPSNLAVELARASDMTLVGFLRGGRFNVYAGEVLGGR